MDCRKGWAVDNDRSRIRWVVDDDRRRRWAIDDERRRRWAVDDNRRREALRITQVNASLERLDALFADFNRSIERICTSAIKLSSDIYTHLPSPPGLTSKTDSALARPPPLPHGFPLPHSPSCDTPARHCSTNRGPPLSQMTVAPPKPSPTQGPSFPPFDPHTFSPPPVPVTTLPPTSNPPSTLPNSLPLPSASSSPSPWSNLIRPPASPSRPTPTAKNTYREDEGNNDRCSAGTEDVDYIYPLDSVVDATSSETHFMEVCDGRHALADAKNNTNDVEVCGKAVGSSSGNVFTAGVKMSGLNSTDKADPTQRSQAARRNITEGLDHKFVGPSYRGLLEDRQLVALKRLSKTSAQEFVEVKNDVLKENFYPWIDQVASTLGPLLKFYFHEEVRRAPIFAMLTVEKGLAQGCGESYLKQLSDYIVSPLVEALHLEPEVEICSSMLDFFNQCMQRSGHLLDKGQIKSSVDEIKHLITTHIIRKRERTERMKAKDFDAKDGEFLKEDKELEEEVFDQGRDKTPKERRIAICIFDDVEQCQGSTLKYYDTYSPLLLEACNIGEYGLTKLLPILKWYELSSQTQNALGYMVPEFAYMTVKCDLFEVLVLKTIARRKPVENDVMVLCDIFSGTMTEDSVEEWSSSYENSNTILFGRINLLKAVATNTKNKNFDPGGSLQTTYLDGVEVF